MMWIVIVLLAVAVVGAIVLTIYGLGLRHRVEAVRSETGVTVGRMRQIAALLGAIDVALLRRD